MITTKIRIYIYVKTIFEGEHENVKKTGNAISIGL